MPARAKPRPLWTCPKCGQRFVSPNMWHSCIRMSVQDHLRGKPKEVVALYRRYARMVRDLGPGVTTSTVKTGIAFMVRVRFAGATPQKSKLRAGFWLKRRIDNPRFTRVEFIPPNNWVYSFDVHAPEDLDEEVLGWLREAYRVGVQERVAPGLRSGQRSGWAVEGTEVGEPSGRSRRTSRVAPAAPVVGRSGPKSGE